MPRFLMRITNDLPKNRFGCLLVMGETVIIKHTHLLLNKSALWVKIQKQHKKIDLLELTNTITTTGNICNFFAIKSKNAYFPTNFM